MAITDVMSSSGFAFMAVPYFFYFHFYEVKVLLALGRYCVLIQRIAVHSVRLLYRENHFAQAIDLSLMSSCKFEVKSSLTSLC